MCEQCKKSFERTMTISKRAKGEGKCPKCKGTKVVSQFGGEAASRKYG